MDFRQAIENTGQDVLGTIILVENISAAMINSLGMMYKLEPEFFAAILTGRNCSVAGSGSTAHPGVRFSSQLISGRLHSFGYRSADRIIFLKD